MYRMIFVGLFMMVAFSFFPGMLGAQTDVLSDPQGEQLDPKADTQTLLTIAAEEQQVAIALGQLATQRAKNEKVKEFGSMMVEEHKRVRRQAEKLASKHHVQLSAKLTLEDKNKIDELSQMTGHEFDRAYMDFTLHNHEATLEEYQQHISTMRYPDLRDYFASTLPILNVHRDQAQLVKSSLQTSP